MIQFGHVKIFVHKSERNPFAFSFQLCFEHRCLRPSHTDPTTRFTNDSSRYPSCRTEHGSDQYTDSDADQCTIQHTHSDCQDRNLINYYTHACANARPAAYKRANRDADSTDARTNKSTDRRAAGSTLTQPNDTSGYRSAAAIVSAHRTGLCTGWRLENGQ